MFDPETYDPYAGFDKYRERNQRLNQTNAAAGLQVLMPEKAAAVNAAAEKLASASSGRMSELHSNPQAQAVAGELLREAFPWLDIDNKTDTTDFKVPFDTRWAEESAPFRALIRTAATKTVVWVPISGLAKQIPEVAAAYLDPESPCDAKNHPDCNYYQDEPSWPDLAAYPIKRGEIVVITFMCSTCRERCNNRDWSADDYPQTGPLRWNPDASKQERDIWD